MGSRLRSKGAEIGTKADTAPDALAEAVGSVEVASWRGSPAEQVVHECPWPDISVAREH